MRCNVCMSRHQIEIANEVNVEEEREEKEVVHVTRDRESRCRVRTRAYVRVCVRSVIYYVRAARWQSVRESGESGERLVQ